MSFPSLVLPITHTQTLQHLSQMHQPYTRHIFFSHIDYPTSTIWWTLSIIRYFSLFEKSKYIQFSNIFFIAWYFLSNSFEKNSAKHTQLFNVQLYSMRCHFYGSVASLASIITKAISSKLTEFWKVFTFAMHSVDSFKSGDHLIHCDQFSIFMQERIWLNAGPIDGLST